MFRRVVLLLFVSVLACPITCPGQEAAPGFQLNKVQQQQDPGSLKQKASRILGYNLIKSILAQGGNPDLEEMAAGMRAAQSGDDQASFIAGYSIAMDLINSKKKSKLNEAQLIAGVKAAQNKDDKKSFISGYQLMENMVQSDADLDLTEILSGMKAASANSPLGMTQEETKAVMTAFGKSVQERKVAKMKALADKNVAEMQAYMDKNKTNPNVKELSNGVQYEVLEKGTGDASPTVDDQVKVDYHGTLVDGTVFDSTVKPPSGLPPQPATFRVNEVVPGFRSALTRMKVGEKWKIAIPGKLAYGARGRGEIGPNQGLIFELKLLGVIPKK